MAESPQKADESSVADVQRKADDFARRRHADTFKRFEKLLKPGAKGGGDEAGKGGEPGSTSENR